MSPSVLVLLVVLMALCLIGAVLTWNLAPAADEGPSLEDQLAALGFVPDGSTWRRGELTAYRTDDGAQLTASIPTGIAFDGSLSLRPVDDVPLSIAAPIHLGWLDDAVLDHAGVLVNAGVRIEGGQATLDLGPDTALAHIVRALDGLATAVGRAPDLDRLAALAAGKDRLAETAARTLADLDPAYARSALPRLPPQRRLLVATLLDDWDTAKDALPGRATTELAQIWLERVAARPELAARVLKDAPTADLQLTAALCLHLLDQLPPLGEVQDPELARLALDTLHAAGHTEKAVRGSLDTIPGWLVSQLHQPQSSAIVDGVRRAVDRSLWPQGGSVAASMVLMAWGKAEDVQRLKALPLEDATDRARRLKERLDGVPGGVSLADGRGGALSLPRRKRRQTE